VSGPRLAIVTRRFWPLVGGPETMMARLAVELTARGCSTTVVTARWQPHWPAEIRYHDVPVVRLSPPPEGRWAMLCYLRSLARWLRGQAGQLDLAYVSMLRQEAYTAVRASRGLVPVALRAEHAGLLGDCLWQLDARCGWRIKSACLKAAAFIAPTPAIQRELEAAGYPRPRIHLVPHGVPLPPPRAPSDRLAARNLLAESHTMLHLPEETLLAVCAGGLADGQGVENLLAAWELVARSRPLARLWLAGEAAARAAIQRQIEARGLTARVVLVGVFDDVEPLLAAADLYVAPSPEGSPVAILEAMAAGLPVVAADAPANREVVTDGQDGLLVPPGSASALANAILRVLEGSELVAQLGTAARARAANFSLARMVEGHLTLFANLV
jgi:glycosyltransferase involved in cell wall biosynthesis